MKKLLNFFSTKNIDSSSPESVQGESEIKQVPKHHDAKNGEITPGHLFEHYNEVLIRPKEILKQLE